MARRPQFRRSIVLTATGALLGLTAIVALTLFVVRQRANALEDSAIRTGNLASVLSEQVAHAVEALDTSLRTTQRLLNAASPGQLDEFARSPAFVSELKAETMQLEHAPLYGVADASGQVVGGAHGVAYRYVSIADRAYFRRLRDDPAAGLVISEPVRNRATGSWMILLARRLSGADGAFRGIVFAGVEPGSLLRTSHAITSVEGQSYSLFDAHGGLLVRYPEPAMNSEIGKPIAASSPWRKVAAAGGGLYHSAGYFDGKAKNVVVRPVEHFPLVVNVALTDKAALARWRERAVLNAVGALLSAALVGALLYLQVGLRRRLARTRMRSWMRAKRFAANTATLAEIRKRFGLTLDYMSHGMAMFDSKGRLIVSNHCYAELYGLKPGQIKAGMSVHDIFELRIAAGACAGADPAEYRQYALSPPFADRTDRLANGRVILVRTKRTEEGGWVTMQEDVTDRIRATERLAYAAMHDSLTGLPNRDAFKKQLEQATPRSQDDGENILVLLFDIDGFKLVNDAYGDEVGNRVLVEVANRLTGVARGAFVARLGGDEFVALLSPPDISRERVLEIAHEFKSEIKRPIVCDGRRVSLRLSVAAVALDSGPVNGSTVLRRADLALAEAKSRGGGQCSVFDMQMEQRFDERAGLSEQLRAAIADDQLELHYQPIIDAADRKIVCMEALVRWRHPTMGMISPAVFIPLAEETGAIIELGEWVMRRACIDARVWPKGIVVAVNVSSLQIGRQDFAVGVAQILTQSGLPPQRLQIEITESVLLQHDEDILSELDALRDMGVSFALDDFGTGYASLAYLKFFPLDKIKIDKSFVDDICENSQSIAIVCAVVALARGLGVAITAEGVETRAQFETLSALGVSTMQGYYFGKPRPIAEQDLDGVKDCAA